MSQLLRTTEKQKQRAIQAEKDKELEKEIMVWIEKVLHTRPAVDDEESYTKFIKDATILSKLMTAIVFNSVPMEDISDKEEGGTNNDISRTKTLIMEMMRYGVRELFSPEELVQGKNIRHVTHCIDELRHIAERDTGNILPATAHSQASR